MAKAPQQQPSPPKSAPIRKARRANHRTRKDSRIHTVWFRGKPMRAWDYSGLRDDFIKQLAKLPPRKRGRKVSSMTLIRLAYVRKRRAEGASWRRVARELYPPPVSVRTAERNLSSLRRTHKL